MQEMVCVFTLIILNKRVLSIFPVRFRSLCDGVEQAPAYPPA